MRLQWLGVLFLSIGLAAAAVAQTGITQRLRGTIIRVDGEGLTLRTEEGKDLALRLEADLAIGAVVNAGLADIKPGVFVGTGAAIEPGGGLRAVQIMIFPEAMRGRGEGHRPWAARPESTMTNATVTDTVETINGRNMTVHYNGGEKTIVIPAGATILRLMPADRQDLWPGARVTVTASAQTDGSLTTARIVVAKDGAEPPL
jgi:hypothetical protein